MVNCVEIDVLVSKVFLRSWKAYVMKLSVYVHAI